MIQAAYEKTAAAKSAKVRMTMTMPTGMAGAAPRGGMEMTGVLGWDPGVMDVTVKGGGLGGAGGSRMVMVDRVIYVDTGRNAPAEAGGKRWMKLDLEALGGKTGDAALQKQLTGSLESMNQDPAEQLALLLDSPNLKHVGPEKVGGVDAQHYRGTLTVDEMVASNRSLSVLSGKEREELVARMKASGLKAYDTAVWVDGDGYPVRMDVGMGTPEGEVEVSVTYSDYGTEAAVQAPPTGQTFDFMEMMEKLSGAARDAGAAA
ncbi:hypothetical protein [Streptomyces sudanensis]|uniref:hypothetical protein n=1 Tax=Streptomyces sudanensis TaxID=436397 RepID=UPI0020CDA2AD|nr:hypothetical protein [Streptomyces sudanensis]MCP9957772.1 hypothetical protein [Streptomyces sudanensis]MCP9986891.1 hypothetical protein [Streptomyces sudanensis]MCQ0001686.1 hypothetical protein [Streptomyces sudanensis]